MTYVYCVTHTDQPFYVAAEHVVCVYDDDSVPDQDTALLELSNNDRVVVQGKFHEVAAKLSITANLRRDFIK